MVEIVSLKLSVYRKDSLINIRQQGSQLEVSTHIFFILTNISIGNGIQDYKESASATAGVVMEKGTYIANGAYNKASQAKHAALDWFSSVTATTNGNSN
jgi:hypothetical protein